MAFRVVVLGCLILTFSLVTEAKDAPCASVMKDFAKRKSEFMSQVFDAEDPSKCFALVKTELDTRPFLPSNCQNKKVKKMYQVLHRLLQKKCEGRARHVENELKSG